MRKSGILMHISSLPSPFGIGTLGQNAYDFVDFLAKTNTRFWQILPINPTGYGDSPYQSFSVFAGNPYFIDFNLLHQKGLLKKTDYETIPWIANQRHIDYTFLFDHVYKVLRKAYCNFFKDSKYDSFEQLNNFWLDDYALFMALKFKINHTSWFNWDEKISLRDKDTIKRLKKSLADEIDFYKFIQFTFYEQWTNLKQYANKNNVEIIGDLPIYVAYDSVDVWANPELFLLDEDKKPIEVAGCPPDFFSTTGQLWGNPLYNWAYHKSAKYSWWIKRLKHASENFNVTRIDHFRGFESFYAIPYGNSTAEIGEWRKGPDIELFVEARKEIQNLHIIAEDLGFLTPEVLKMLNKSRYPGMKVLQFAFDNPSNTYLPHNYTKTNCIVYTGTHDNDTLYGWVSSLPKKNLSFCKKYLNISRKKDIPKSVIKLAWSSVADTSIAQIQDFLKLDSSFRMNTPSTTTNNWQFRALSKDFTEELAKEIYKLNKLYNRNGGLKK